MKIKYLLILASLLFIAGCSKDESSANYVVDVHGYKYVLVSPEVTNKEGIVTCALWERVEPKETNHYYTPSLSSTIKTNDPIIFISISR